jgi:hypothetical protein
MALPIVHNARLTPLSIDKRVKWLIVKFDKAPIEGLVKARYTCYACVQNY